MDSAARHQIDQKTVEYVVVGDGISDKSFKGSIRKDNLFSNGLMFDGSSEGGTDLLKR